MKKIKNMMIIFLIFAGMVFILQSNCKRKSAEPNIVLIVIDTLRADHLPFYGYKKNTAPFLSKIASQGIVFENAFSASTWTAPATASIFTSLYPVQHGVIRGYWASRNRKIELHRIPGKIKTIPEVLKEKGYKTYGAAANVNICSEQGFTQGFERFRLFPYRKEEKINPQLKEWAKEIKSQKKYFLYIHYNDPHRPYHKRLPGYKERKNKRSDIIARYDSEIHYVDQKIKDIFDFFSWNKNTLLIVTADHGEGFTEHNQTGHSNTLYSEVLHVPFIIYFPEEDRVPKRIKCNVSTIDILPTITDYLGIENNETREGISLMPLILGETEEDTRRFFFPYLRTQKDMTLLLRGTIWNDWKYIFSNKNTQELYNLKDDPGEKVNLSHMKKDMIKRLLSKYFEFEKSCKKFKRESKKTKLEAEKIKELKTLGYVE